MGDIWSRIGALVAVGSAAAYLTGVTTLSQFADPLGLTVQDLGLDFRTYVVVAAVAFIVTAYISVFVVTFLAAAYGIVDGARANIQAQRVLLRERHASAAVSEVALPAHQGERMKLSTRLTAIAAILASAGGAGYAILICFLILWPVVAPAPFILGNAGLQLELALLAALSLAVLLLLAAFWPAEHARRAQNRQTFLPARRHVKRLAFTVHWTLAHRVNLTVLVIGGWLIILSYAGLAGRAYAHDVLDSTTASEPVEVPRPPLLLAYAIRPRWVCLEAQEPSPLIGHPIVRIVDFSRNAVLAHQGRVWTTSQADRAFVTAEPLLDDDSQPVDSCT